MLSCVPVHCMGDRSQQCTCRCVSPQTHTHTHNHHKEIEGQTRVHLMIATMTSITRAAFPTARFKSGRAGVACASSLAHVTDTCTSATRTKNAQIRTCFDLKVNQVKNQKTSGHHLMITLLSAPLDLPVPVPVLVPLRVPLLLTQHNQARTQRCRASPWLEFDLSSNSPRLVLRTSMSSAWDTLVL